VLAGSPADFGKLIVDETEKWGKVIRAANIKAQRHSLARRFHKSRSGDSTALCYTASFFFVPRLEWVILRHRTRKPTRPDFTRLHTLSRSE
jgi:hypothetical protein